MVKISVIIPVYNVENYLQACLQSVLMQSVKDLEIICINDASTDASLHILKDYRALDPRLVIIDNEKHLGVSRARNLGLESARGKYIFFVDADDMLQEGALKALYDRAEVNSLDGIFFDTDIIFETEELREQSKYKCKRKGAYPEITSGADLFALQIAYKEYDPCIWRQFWSRDLLLSNHILFYEDIIHEDRLFTFQAILSAKRTQCINSSYYIHRKRVSSITTSDVTMKNIEGIFVGVIQMLEFWKTHSFEPATDQAIHQYIVYSFGYIKTMAKRTGFYQISKYTFLDKMTHCYFEMLGMNQFLQKPVSLEEYMDQLAVSEHIILYGAGMYAQRVLAALDENDLPITCIAVTDKDQNPQSLMGNRVYGIDQLMHYRDNSIIIIAVDAIYQAEIEELLQERGFHNYIKP